MPLSTLDSSNGAQAWIQMRPLSPSMSLENGSVRLTMPDGRPVSDAQTSAPVAITNGDVSASTNQFKGESSAFQPQQEVTPSAPPFSNAPTVQNQNTTVPPSYGLSSVAQGGVQALQATANPQISFHSPSQSEGPRQRSFGGNMQPTAHLTSQQPQPRCFLPTTNVLFNGPMQQQSPFADTNVGSITHPQYQPQFCDTDNRFNTGQETSFPLPATAALNTILRSVTSTDSHYYC